MKDIVLNSQQLEAMEKSIQWYKHDRFKRPFILNGYAGTGKTTVAKTALNNLYALGLDPARVALAAPTGKAAQVLTRRTGRKAQTLHSLMYKPASTGIEHLRDELTRIHDDLENKEDYDSHTRVVEIKEEIDGIEESEVRFHLKGVENLDLILVDEMSMIPQMIARDILEQHIPVFLMGDPGQLDPVKSEPAFGEFIPDVLLTKIERQSGDGAGIVLAAQAVRLGENPRDGDGFRLCKRGTLEPEDFLSADVILCGKNTTRKSTNKWVRKQKNYPADRLVPGEKIICTRNMKDVYTGVGRYDFFNGEIFLIENIADKRGNDVYLDLRDVEGKLLPGVKAWHPYFFDEEDRNIPRDRLQFQFAYAITVHKSQGSEFERVVIDGQWGGGNYDKWLYTAITRAVSDCKLTNYLN